MAKEKTNEELFEEAMERLKLLESSENKRPQSEIYARCEFDWEVVPNPSDAPIQW